MPSALNPAPTLADIQRGQSAAAASPPSGTTPQHPAFGDSVLRRRRSSHSSHESHGSHPSHSSHSSYAARHPDRVPQKAASPNRAFLSVLALLALFLFYTLSGLWLFVKGFLLTRHELTRINECAKPFNQHWTLPSPPASFDDASLLAWAENALDADKGQGECRLKPTHIKAVVIIIDALRYDFIAPPPPADAHGEGEGEWKPNPYYHNILSLPAELTAKHGVAAYADGPGPSGFLAHFAADPPTTTLQRLKGLTTGTLPTFVEAGANFGSAGTGVGVIREDNWIAQFKRHILSTSPSPEGNAGLVFAGDDTWATVLPGLFDNHTTWSYDSFNVEDLDTVDRGVESKLLPFLQKNHPDRTAGLHDSWRLLVGHTLGVDHVGHRFGASHPKMATKLAEMQTLIRNITSSLDDDTLFILMGDHGMDERGDHGGDAELEVGAALWIYSPSGFGYTKRRPITRPDPAAYISSPSVDALLPSCISFSPLPSSPINPKGHRSVPQIDLVPTLSILLGLPIPYNNLGSIIPDLFPHPHSLLRALRITARQMRTYLTTYAATSPDLAAFAPEFDALWLDAVRADAELARIVQQGGKQAGVEEAWQKASKAYHRFNRVSLVRAREVWAEFDMQRITAGLVVLILGLAVGWVLRAGAQKGLIGNLHVDTQDAADAQGNKQLRLSKGTEELFQVVYDAVLLPAALGAAVGAAVAVSPVPMSLTLLDGALCGASIVSSFAILVSGGGDGGGNFVRSLTSDDQEKDGSPATTKLLNSAGWTVLVIHAALFASNSFLVWEDRFTLLALGTLLVIRGLVGIGSAPDSRGRIRIAVLTLIALVLIRLASIPKVCREEQAPHCTSTFFASSSSSSGSDTGGAGAGAGAALNSPYTMAATYALAYILPLLLARFLQQSKSYVGIAPVFFSLVLRPSLMLGAGYWILDYVIPLESIASLGWKHTLEWVKGWVAKGDLILLVVLAVTFWVFAPLCLEIRRETVQATTEGEAEDKVKVTILGYANSFGSSYVLLVAVVVSVLWLVTQPTGQLALGAVWIAGMACVELGDAERNVVILYRQRAALAASTPDTATAVSKKKKKKPKKVEPTATATATPAAASPTSAGRPIHLSSTEIATLILLSYLAFFATGHQATLASIQWRTAFITSNTLSYPLSPILVMLNSFGAPTLLPAFLTSLSVLWNTTPLPRGSNRKMLLPQQLLHALLSTALYQTALLAAAAVLAGLVFRRHLMLFKVWTPRFMLAAVNAVLGQLAGVVAATAAWQTANKVNTIFGSEFA